jgi:hypothetical protein
VDSPQIPCRLTFNSIRCDWLHYHPVLPRHGGVRRATKRAVLDNVKQKQNDHDNDDSYRSAA